MKYKGLIFDLDGTLINSLYDIADSMNHVLSKHSFPIYSYDDYKYFIGNGIEHLVTSTVPKILKDNSSFIEQCLTELKKEYHNNWNKKTRLYNGVSNMLDSCQNNGLKLSILSNKPHDLTIKTVSHFLSKWKFKPILGTKDGINKKPDPQGAILILNQFNLLKNQVLYLGDTSTDMQTAKNAGFVSVGVTWGFRTEKELVDHGANYIIKHPRELIPIIGSNSI